jgi:hypothetical protein
VRDLATLQYVRMMILMMFFYFVSVFFLKLCFPGGLMGFTKILGRVFVAVFFIFVYFFYLLCGGTNSNNNINNIGCVAPRRFGARGSRCFLLPAAGLLLA